MASLNDPSVLSIPLIGLAVGLAACSGGGDGAAAPAETAATPDPVTASPATAKPFVDATAASNISYEVAVTLPAGGAFVADSTFGGAAAGDCDADGDVDLFITYGDGGPNRLYINQLDQGSGVPLQFLDTAASAGVANTRSDGRGNDRHSGPSFADMDGDGDLDLFVGGLFGDPNKLYRNRGDCRFDDVTVGSGIDGLLADHTISSAFGDYDLDGDLDLFLTHWESEDEFPVGGQSEHLFRNDSDDAGIRFANVSGETGVTARLLENRAFSAQSRTTDYTYTPTFAHINDDVWPDIVIAADYGTSQLLLNNSPVPGRFADATNAAVHAVQYGMGSALGDFDSDGDLDWFVTAVFEAGDVSSSLRGNVLLENPGGDFSVAGFRNITAAAGVANGRWGWGACFADLDNDTDLDIYHTNGWEQSFPEEGYDADKSLAFISDGAGAFVDEAAALGLDDRFSGRGVVCSDLDHDGDIDILQLTNKPGNSAVLWQNESATAGRNFLRVRLHGLAPNTEAAGARILVTIGSKTQMREITIGSNFTSQNPTVQVFGLGNATSVDELRVQWPGRLPGPVRPEDSVAFNVSASGNGQTLEICHPGLRFGPADCAGL